MAGVLHEADIPGRPGPSVQEMLSRETRPVPAALCQEFNDSRGTEDLDKERYYAPEFYRLEVERMWNRVWQIACRVEEIPTVGDHIIYEVGDYSLIVVRSRPTEIKVFHNACLHRGRILRETGGHVSQFTCKFHGFTWRLDGTLSFVPGRWDFPQIKDEEFCLPEAKVGVWGGYANLVYRFRSWANDPEQALMEIIVLPPAPKDIPAPPPAPMHLLGPDETFADAKELGDLGPFFNQDLGNME